MKIKPEYFKLVFQKIDPKSLLIPDVEIRARHDGIYVHMTPKITESQFDGYIDLLIEELEYIRGEGKRKFASAKKLQAKGKIRESEFKKCLLNGLEIEPV